EGLPRAQGSGVLAAVDRRPAHRRGAARARRYPRPRRDAARPAEDAVTAAVALRTEDLCKSWGGISANDHVSLTLPIGARHALIGPNGAGKTTFVNLLTGLYPPSAGRVLLGDTDI